MFIASIHLSLNAANALIPEAVRAFYNGFYRDIVTQMPRIDNGFVYPMRGGGLGTRLRDDIRKRSDVTVRRSAA